MGNALGSIPLNLQHEFPFEPQHSKARKTGVIRRNDDDVKIIRIQDVLDLDVIAGDVDGEVRDSACRTPVIIQAMRLDSG